MLFHVTATHGPEECPLYDPEIQDAVRSAYTTSEDLARELGVTVHFAVTGAPDHVNYNLLEADDFSAIQRFLSAIPLRQEFTITPVVSVKQATETFLADEGR